MIIKPFYRRNLPHITLNEKAYFITFWLNRSIPTDVMIRLKTNYDKEWKILSEIKYSNIRKKKIYDLQKKYFGIFDNYLNNAENNIKWLGDDRIANIVSESIRYRNKKDYELLAYNIMPNHVHLVIFVERFVKPLHKILQSLKRHTARKSNIILNRTGNAFWHSESYDHYVRDYKELSRIIDYTMNDPVKTGLARNAEEWKWSYCKY
ncbi:MAG TPA: transposase [Ignavibacteria bacterium]|nr:transposase [Ignavibacteria bacterium]